MAEESTTIAPNPSLTFEDFGHEVVAIDLSDGSYFTLKGGSVEVWRLIGEESRLDRMLAALADRFVLDEPSLGRIADFLTWCEDASLVQVTGDLREEVLGSRPSGQGTAPLPDLEFEKISDIQDILTLDPIHDVDDTGWPHKPSGPST